MAEIRMPSLGADMDTGTLSEWKIRVGDVVARGTIVAVVETQKAAMEIESYVAGVVEALLVEPGSVVPVGAPLARVGSGGEVATAAPAPAPPAVTAEAARLRISPAARKLARALDLDPHALTGSGPHGAIVLRDVQALAARRAAPTAPASAPTPPPTAPPAAPRPVAGASPRPTAAVAGPMRDAIAAAVSRSKREIPHYYLSHTISMKRSLDWLTETNRQRPVADRLLPAVLFLRAVVDALWDVPELNGFWLDGAYRASEPVHLGTAIALRGGGVIAPALLDAEQKSVDQLMAELRDLVSRSRAARLRSTEMTAATITVTSLGDRGCEAVWGVINPPQVAIVGFGAVSVRPWVRDGQVVAEPLVTATLAADHRVSDGHRGGLFLAAVDRHLQEPERP
jgi:pyruvate dehydrogenase E2 component (dihydrolipoyllysine-residue acetyltransferase)